MLQDERSRERRRERGRHLKVRFACATFAFGLVLLRLRAQVPLDVGLSKVRDAAAGGECAEADEEVDEQA
jgi:hypothetical protein